MTNVASLATARTSVFRCLGGNCYLIPKVSDVPYILQSDELHQHSGFWLVGAVHQKWSPYSSCLVPLPVMSMIRF